MTTERVDRDELLAEAERCGFTVTPRQLASLRQADLMPRPTRTTHGGRRGVPTYPATAAAQLAEIQRLRGEGRRRPGDVAVGLLMAGHQLDPDVVRRSLTTHLTELEAFLRTPVPMPSRTTDQTVEWAPAIAHVFAASRSRHLPHLWRMSLADRTKAFGLVLLLFLDDASALTPEAFEEAEAAYERLMGLHLARLPVASQAAWLAGRTLAGFAEVASLPVLRDAICEASPDELERGQLTARRFAGLAPIMALTIEAMDDRRGRGGMEALMDLSVETATVQGFWLAYFVAMHRSHLAPNLLQIEESLRPIEQISNGLRWLLDQPAEQYRRQLRRLSPEQRSLVARARTVARRHGLP